MRQHFSAGRFRFLFAGLFVFSHLLFAQAPAVPPGFGPSSQAEQEFQRERMKGQAQPAPVGTPGTPQARPNAPGQANSPTNTLPPIAAQPQGSAAAPSSTTPATPNNGPIMGGLNLQGVALTEVINILAGQLKINYILDPSVKGGVSLNTYGETKDLNARELLDMILRINGFAMVQVGDVYRIVPMAEVARLPIPPTINSQNLPDGEQVVLNLVFLKYANVEEVTKLLNPFIGENAKTWAYPPANLLLLLDSARNIRRTMDLLALFDNDTFTGQRVRLFDTKNGRPSELSKELESVFKGISLNEKSSPIKFLPIDRINTIVAVAPNPGAFEEVEKWLKKLDIPVKVTTGTVDNFVYRVKYGNAMMMAMAIMSLYGGYGNGMGMMGMMSMMGMGGMGMGGMGMGGMGMGGMGMGAGSMTGGLLNGMNGMGGMYGMGGMGMGGMGMGGMYGGMGGMGMGGFGNPAYMQSTTGGQAGAAPANTAGNNATGTYLGNNPQDPANYPRMPRVIPNPLDNTLLISGTPGEYESILKLLQQLDIPPRQVLIEAKIYEVSLTGALSNGVAAYLQNQRNVGTGFGSNLTGQFANGALTLSSGLLIGQTRQLLTALSTQQVNTRTKVISAPSIIATDSIPASINVGSEVPTLTAQAVTGVQSGGNSLFANTISNRSTGVTLNITARVNPSGIVTLLINQEVSAPQAPTAGGIQSPSFSKRSVQTQVTVEDGDTIAIGGIISESSGNSSAGLPGLHKIPVLGWAFGSKSISNERSELIIFMTPRVIYDTKEIVEASEELKSRLRRLSRYVKE